MGFFEILALVSVYTGLGEYIKEIDVQDHNQSYIFSVPGVIQQDNHSCGFWTLFHAKAVQECIDKLGTVNVQVITESALNYENCITEASLSSDELQDCSQHITKLNNLDVLTFETTNQVFVLQQDLAVAEQKLEADNNYSHDRNASLVQDVSVNCLKIKNDLQASNAQNKVHHFACFVNENHWVLISIVKLANRQKLDLIYIDSLGESIGSGPIASRKQYLNFFKQQFLSD